MGEVEFEVVYVGLGSNLGDRERFLREAVDRIGRLPGVRVTGQSSVLETKPVGPIQQSDFLNSVVRVETSLSPIHLLNALLGIERSLGRERQERWGPRTIDLDILYYGDQRIDTPPLRIPHPEIRHRPFVVDGLRELGKTVE